LSQTTLTWRFNLLIDDWRQDSAPLTLKGRRDDNATRDER
jgi:hypothetical protein